MIKEWGVHIWSFLHIFCQSINEKQLLSNKNDIYGFISSVMCNLPCPECSYHARLFIINCNFNNLNSKQQMIKLFFDFHNKVSARVHSKNPKYKNADINILDQYKNRNIKEAFRTYHAEWTKASNIKNILAMTSTFNRHIFMENTIKWMKSHLHLFEPELVV